MRVRVSYVVNVDDHFRRAIRRFYGQDGLATRDEVATWFRAYGDSMNDDLAQDEPPILEEE